MQGFASLDGFFSSPASAGKTLNIKSHKGQDRRDLLQSLGSLGVIVPRYNKRKRGKKAHTTDSRNNPASEAAFVREGWSRVAKLMQNIMDSARFNPLPLRLVLGWEVTVALISPRTATTTRLS